MSEDRVEFSTQRVEEASARIARTSHLLRLATILLLIVVLAAVAAFGTLSAVQANADAHRSRQELAKVAEVSNFVEQITNPHSPYTQKQQAQTEQLIEHLILCIDNHLDLEAGRTTTVLPGCPGP